MKDNVNAVTLKGNKKSFLLLLNKNHIFSIFFN